MIKKTAVVVLVGVFLGISGVFSRNSGLEKSVLYQKLKEVSKMQELNEKQPPTIDLEVTKHNQNALEVQLYDNNDETVEQTAYLLIKTLRHRDKRYVGYMSLCHFKICNMGKRPATRYSQIRPHRNNNGKK